MDTKKILKITAGIILVAIPFGLTAVAGYYGYKKYRDIQDKKKLKEKEVEK